MKYYESSYEDYIQSVERYNIHPELEKIYDCYPSDIHKLENTIIYGASGVGKYSQLLYLLRKYSASNLKYEKKIIAATDKLEYKYKISDIHYEIDMGLIGCNSKTLWSEIFSQIVDIISVKSVKIGIIVCKNFHLIHSELLEIFYSYIQHYNHDQTSITLKFILLTEHISFIPNKILNVCHILSISRPSKEKYYIISKSQANKVDTPLSNQDITYRFTNGHKDITNDKSRNIISLVNNIDTNGITNIKELKSFDLLYSNSCQVQKLPDDNFNIICNKVIEYIIIDKELDYLQLRDCLYDILTYNLDAIECVWYIVSYLVVSQHLQCTDISDICKQSYLFLKYYNNNYRPIYHLESIFYYIAIKVRSYHEI
jgi:hypothetical protein